jgi:hypothetical protein
MCSFVLAHPKRGLKREELKFENYFFKTSLKKVKFLLYISKNNLYNNDNEYHGTRYKTTVLYLVPVDKFVDNSIIL